jgi:hypothetical protein
MYRLKTLSHPSMPRLNGITGQASQAGAYTSLSRNSNNSATRVNTRNSREHISPPQSHVVEPAIGDASFHVPSNAPHQWQAYHPQQTVYAMDPFVYGVDENSGFTYAVPYYYPYQAVPMIPEQQAELVSEVPTEVTADAVSSDPFISNRELEAITHPEVDAEVPQQVSIAIPDTEPLIK